MLSIKSRSLQIVNYGLRSEKIVDDFGCDTYLNKILSLVTYLARLQSTSNSQNNKLMQIYVSFDM